VISSLLLYAGWLVCIGALVSVLRRRTRAPRGWMTVAFALWTVSNGFAQPWDWALLWTAIGAAATVSSAWGWWRKRERAS
jgi:hypothetical protein